MKLILLAALLGMAWAAPIKIQEIANFFFLLDTNKDGTLTPAEFDATYKALDTDGNGEISPQELLAVFGDTLTEATIYWKQSDFNKDGKYDKADYDASFKAMDVNGDGKVNALEFGNLTKDYPEAGEIKLLAVGAEGLASLFKTLDTDNDTYISPAELKSLYDSFDTDKDGKVSKAEFKAKYQPTMNLNDAEGDAIFAKVDSNADGFLDDAERDAIFKGHDENGDGKVSEVEFVTTQLTTIRDTKIALAKAGAKYPSIQDALMDLANKGIKALFDSRDADKDGFLSLDEEKKAFSRFDSDGDFKVTAAEATPLLSNTFKVNNRVAGVMFKAVDSNGDSVLSADEVAAFYKLADGDGDNKLSFEEFKDSVIATISISRGVADGKLTLETARTIVTGAVGLSALFDTFDTDSDGAISDSEFDKEIGQKLDLDADSKVSPLEFLPRIAVTFGISVEEADAIFKRTDRNNDGYIDKAESKLFYNSFDLDGDGKVTDFEFVKKVLERLAEIKAQVGISVASNLFG